MKVKAFLQSTVRFFSLPLPPQFRNSETYQCFIHTNSGLLNSEELEIILQDLSRNIALNFLEFWM